MLASFWQPGAGRGVGLAVALLFVAGRAVYRRARRRASASDAPATPAEPLDAEREGKGPGTGDASQAFAQRDEEP